MWGNSYIVVDLPISLRTVIAYWRSASHVGHESRHHAVWVQGFGLGALSYKEGSALIT